MTEIRSVKLEFLRPGPAHNQLLSPLTPYVAVCGNDGSVTLTMPFEHREILIRLRRLRYESNVDPAADIQRQAEVRSMGEAIGEIVGKVPSLLSAINSAGNCLVHLRLVISPSELGMMPFEMAISPNAFPGSGTALFLQPCVPITVTRELRRSTPLKLEWDRIPRILFVFATPPGYAPVPAQSHLNALRRAIEPWVDIVDPGEKEKRLQKLRDHITVLPNATLEDIRRTCAESDFTHVHILAHGDEFQDAGESRFGVALVGTLDSTKADIVDGTRLAIALSARNNNCATRSIPTVVSLATCDSGNIKSILTPGGSIAHALHLAGIPWVFASQFPLWMSSSTLAAEILYSGLLSGGDLRCVLFELRQRLRANAPGTHDWASIVAYASVPWDFSTQVQKFRYRQTKRRAEVQLDRLENLKPVKADDDGSFRSEMENRHQLIRTIIREWIAESISSNDPKQASERLGMGGAMEKRIALNLEAHTPNDREKIEAAYEAAMDYYSKALHKSPTNHWVATQYLSLAAARKREKLPPPGSWKKLLPWWQAAEQIARWEYTGTDGYCTERRVWAIGTLLELITLGVVFVPAEQWNANSRKHEAVALAEELVLLVGAGGDDFPLKSTVRQFRRYRDSWGCSKWDEMVLTILKALGEPVVTTEQEQA